MARTRRIALIGGGIGGITAAIALRQRGFEVSVHEQSPALAEVGAGLQLGPNAVKVYRALGMEDDLRKIGGQPVNALTLNWTDNTPLARGNMRDGMIAQFGAPYYNVHRADMLHLIARAIPESCLHLGKRCLGVNAKGSARFADGSEIEADIVIGSDGVRSMVRTSLFGAEAPRYTGMECWRATLPVEKVTQRGFGNGETFTTDDAVNWLGPMGRVVCYPISGGKIFNIFCGHVGAQWTDESWTIPSSLDEVLAAYQGYHETMLAMFHQVDPRQWFKWGVFDRDPLPRWNVGHVTLLGDAAHPMPPTLAQGAAMAIEDAYALARCLAERDDMHEGLRQYEAERLPHTTRAQLQAREQFELNQSVPPKPRASRDWMFAHDVTRTAPPSAESTGKHYDSGEEV